MNRTIFKTTNFHKLLVYFILTYGLTGVTLLLVVITGEYGWCNAAKLIVLFALVELSDTIPRHKKMASFLQCILMICQFFIPAFWGALLTDVDAASEKTQEMFVLLTRLFLLIYVIALPGFIYCLKWTDDGKEHKTLDGKIAPFFRNKRFSKPLKVLKNSGSVAIAMSDLTDNTTLFKQFFTNIDYVKQEDENTLLLKQKCAIKPQTRIEVSKGRLCLLAHHEATGRFAKVNAEDYVYSNSRSYTYIHTDLMYNRIKNYKKGIVILAGVVMELPKNERSLEIRLYDNYTNTLVANKLFCLSPVIIHEYYPELHYTDAHGKNQVYTEDSERMEPLGANSVVSVVVKNEYGKVCPVVSFYYGYSRNRQRDAVEYSVEGDIVPEDVFRFGNFIRPCIKDKTVVIRSLRIKK